MRVLGDRSLVTILKLLVNIAYFGAFALGGLLALIVVLVALYRPEGLSLEIPAKFEIDAAAYDITAPGKERLDVEIQEAEGEVHVKGVGPMQVIQGFGVALISVAVAIFVLRQFRGIFRTLSTGQPFVQANVRRIRVLGLTVMIGEIVRAASISWSSAGLAKSFTSDAIRFRPDFEPSSLVIFAGALLLVLAEVFREAATMKRDLETAREIQFDLVPSEEFKKDRVRVRSRMRPANTVGGDYYDVIPLDERKVAVVQGDVAGKGIPAALLMAVLQGSLRTLVSAGFRGEKLVSALNNYLNDNTPANKMVTLFYGELDTETGEMSFVNAGHNLPFHIRRDGNLERPGSSSRVLGILPDTTFTESKLRLEPGERLLLFTDGVSEAFNDKDAEYGDERVSGFLKRHPGKPDDELVHGLVSDVLSFCNPAKPTDDMTLVLVSRE